MNRSIRSVLVANRGEIAVRILRSLRSLGLKGIAALSETDASSLAARLASDLAILGPSEPAESYMNIERIIEAAKAHDVDAVHPGYGFLSERAEFASAVEDAGFIFLGPRPAQITALGDKLAARKLIEVAGIGPVPGSDGSLSGVAAARALADRIGYPMLLKATAGGGGRGLRIVRSEEELRVAFDGSATEARGSFGTSSVFGERYMEGARHVEIQVLGDGEGGVRLFPERDCSIQRRLQKLVEESPCPAVTEDIRSKLLGTAWKLVQDTKYRGAGTLEFLLNPEGELFFLEMNTRIQVEHPISEVLTSCDMVAEQIRIAEGATYTGSTPDACRLPWSGASIELRINAEDVLENFRPQVGTITALHWPAGPGIRVDSGILPSEEITPHYDGLLAKIIARGADREQALGRLRAALDETAIGGIATTLTLGRALLRDEGFCAGSYHCQYLLERSADPEFLQPILPRDEARALAAAVAILRSAELESKASRPRAENSRTWRKPPTCERWGSRGSEPT